MTVRLKLVIALFLAAVVPIFTVHAQPPQKTYTAYRGQYSSATIYGLGDLVTFSGSLYMSTALGPNQGNTPTASGAYWISFGGSGAGYFSGTPTVAVTGSPTNTSMVWVATSNTAAAPRQLTQDDILPGFSITNFCCGAAVEIGATVTNPVFYTGFSSTPASANITNSDGISSPLNLSSPWTGGTVTGSFHKTSQTSTSFTLTAVSGVTRTAGQGITWLPRNFSGIGAAGASSSVSASGNSAVLSNSAVLADGGLNGNPAGQTFGPLSPNSQKVYLLLVGGSHTFKDAGSGFAFAFNSPTAVSFVNQNGATVAMYLYESTTMLSGTYSVLVVN